MLLVYSAVPGGGAIHAAIEEDNAVEQAGDVTDCYWMYLGRGHRSCSTIHGACVDRDTWGKFMP